MEPEEWRSRQRSVNAGNNPPSRAQRVIFPVPRPRLHAAVLYSCVFAKIVSSRTQYASSLVLPVLVVAVAVR